MIVILWLAYVTFAMNWVAGSSLAPQITRTFFGDQPVDPIITQLVNYSITTARVFANLLAAYVLVRLAPKRAAGLAIGLLIMALVAIYLPNYWAYAGARMLMALGGSMIIVYMNPVVAYYIKDAKLKLWINAMNTLSYNLGAFIVSALFAVFAARFVQDWRLTLTFFAATTIILFIAWILQAENFETSEPGEINQEEYRYSDAIRDPFLWIYALAFACFLTLYVNALVSMKPLLDEHTVLNGSVVNLLVSGAAIAGTFVGIAIGNKGTPRKQIFLVSGIIMIAAYALTLALGNSQPLPAYLFAALSGFFMFIQYPIFLNLAHELQGMNPKKLTVLFGLFWAIGYAVQTINTIIWSFLLGAVGYTIAMVFLLAVSSLYVVFSAMLPETKPKKILHSRPV